MYIYIYIYIFNLCIYIYIYIYTHDIYIYIFVSIYDMKHTHMIYGISSEQADSYPSDFVDYFIQPNLVDAGPSHLKCEEMMYNMYL